MAGEGCMGKIHKHLTWDDRVRIDTMLGEGIAIKRIAERLGVHISTIYREVKRGRYDHLNSRDWTTAERYSPDIAYGKYKKNLKEKGTGLKIGEDPKLAEYIEKKIIADDYSPEAVLGYIKRSGKQFQTSICTTTLYSYISRGVFQRLSLKMLPVKRNQKPKKKKVEKDKRARAPKGESIERRPLEVESRQSFGHWEMDSVVGAQGKSEKAMLVFTERKTRMEIIELLKDHTAESVVKALNKVERRYGAIFKQVFKSITVDNGCEFANCEGMEKARRGESRRTIIYYCHTYSSWERGSNEVNNRLIRRKIPKGTNFDDKTSGDIKEIEQWMNHYPRRMFNYATSEEMYQKEVELLLSG